jgi:ABC-2 type transport system permease protein
MWMAFRFQFTESVRHQATVVLAVLQPMVFLTLALTGSTAGQGSNGSRMVVGSVTMALWSTTQWSAGTILRREMITGTLASLITRPTPLLSLVMAKSAGAATAGLGLALPPAVAAAFLSGNGISVPRLGALLLLAVPSAVSAAAMGLLLSTVILVSRAGLRIVGLLTFPTLLFGGFLVPTTALPGYLRWIGDLVPLRWIAEIMSSGAQGRVPAVTSLLALTVLTALYWAAGRRLLYVALRRCLVKGELDFA